MINCKFFHDALIKMDVNFFTGVPDSLLKDFCSYVTAHTDPDRHIIAANEGGAVALACGYYLATGKIGLVYMQNSGQGNAINPLVSLADSDIYGIPMLLLIGWRGEPGTKDEPQHIKQGRITLSLLDTLAIPYKVLSDNPEEARKSLEEIIDVSKKRNGPAALVIRQGTFEPYQMQKNDNSRGDSQSELTREDAIKTVVDNLNKSDIVVSTTGKISRELYEYRERIDGDHGRDFLTVGSMGHCSQIAMAIALAKPNRQVYCFDGDGAVIMHLGAVAIIGSHKAGNLKHIVFNNGCHDSVGGQPTCGFAVSVTDIAAACGYELVLRADTKKETDNTMKIIKSAKGPAMLEIKVKKGARENLGRPKSSPQDNKAAFMKFLSD